MNNTEATMGITGRSQRPGIGETRRPVQHSLGESQAELPAFAVHREQTFSLLQSHGLSLTHSLSQAAE